MRAVVAVYRGDQQEIGALALGELVKLDETYSVRLVGFDVESLNDYLIRGDIFQGAYISCKKCHETQDEETLATFFSFAVEHELRH
jgi:hypothetical protein